jgi:biotin carboxylase
MSKDIIIFVNAIRPATFKALKDYEAQSGRHFTPIVLVDEAIKESIFTCNGQYNLPEVVEVVTANFSSATSVRQALAPHENRIFAVTSQYENCIQELRKLLPYLPYIPTPTEKSLIWATEKKLMRKMLGAYDPSLVPGYMEVFGSGPSDIQKIEARLTYPMVVKPSGLEGSLLVSYVKDRQELQETLRHTFLAMQKAYDTWVKRQKPAVLVEEFMVGDMYTVDVYVDAQGACRYTPTIGDIVGRTVGYDDLFGYMEFLPSELDDTEIEKSQQAASKACHALGLRSTTAHVELMRTASGWKIIELGPRIGGYRYEIYDRAYGINHIMNDIRNRAGETPDIPTELHNYVSVFDIYAREEGTLKAVHGLETIKKLASFTYLRQTIFEGEPVLFAKNGGDVVLNIMLSHPDKAQLKADIVALESAIVLEVTKQQTE